jgi:hypothetical protein
MTPFSNFTFISSGIRAISVQKDVACDFYHPKNQQLFYLLAMNKLRKKSGKEKAYSQ